MIELIITLIMRLATTAPDIIAAIQSREADADERLRLWLENQDDLRSEANRLDDIVNAAKGRLG